MFLCCQSSFLPCSHIIFADDRTGSIYPEIQARLCSLRAPVLLLYLFWEHSFHPSNSACLGQDPSRAKPLYSDGWGRFCSAHFHRSHFSSVNCRQSQPSVQMAPCWWREIMSAEQKRVTNCIVYQLANLTLLLLGGEWKADPLGNDLFWCGEVIAKMIFPPSEAVTQPWKCL